MGHKTSAPLELIFSDVWGPAPIFSSDGFRYFVIFIDAHTKHIWYYPLVVKSDVFSTFQCFQTLVERQFSLKIKPVQTDWGGEYRKLNKFFQTIGFHHRLICPHTHEQNGTVERRHRHIVETGLIFLGQCSAPLRFWNYAFISLVYLINCMPTLVLQNKSSFECLFRRPPDYNFLRTFGCLCFSFLRLYHAHKLDFQSSPCVFLGYSSSHLGYRCFDLESHRIYVSRQVRFHEIVFPFEKSEQVTSLPVPPTPPTYLPSSNPSPYFLRTTPQPAPPNNPILPSTVPHQTIPLTIAFTTPLSPSHTAILSPHACLSNDYCAGIGSPSSDAHVLRSAATEQSGSAAEYPSFAATSPSSAVPTSPSTAFPALYRPLFISSSVPSSYRSHFSMSNSSSTSHGPPSKTA